MKSSMVSMSRRLCLSLLANPSKPSSSSSSFPLRFCSTLSSPETSNSDDTAAETEPEPEPEPEPKPNCDSEMEASSSTKDSDPQRGIYDRPLENGLDVGIYKAILVGQVGQTPLQKKLRSGRMVTLLSIGTGGIRNNRRPFDNEEPRDYANRCAVQWHRVSIYPERLGAIAMKHVVPGSILYLEGNLETKIFTDPITGLVRRIREVAIRRNGRVVFLGKGDEVQQPKQVELKGVGYY